MLKAVIFDMDGLLIDSEPLWQKAEIEIFGKLGINLTVEMCLPLQGKKLDEVVEYWYNFKPWDGFSFEQVKRMIIEKMKFLLKNDLKFKFYALELIDFVHKSNLKSAIASSSYLELIQIVVEKAKIKNKIQVIHSSEFEKRGKPHPDIFLTTAQKLNVPPSECIVLEDSPNGILAAKRANMQVIAVPDSLNFNDKKFDIADFKVKNLLEAQKIIQKMITP